MASGAVTPGAIPTIERHGASPAAVSAAGRWRPVTRGLTHGAFGVILLLAALAPIARTGDAHQYYAMAIALADFRPPALTGDEVDRFKAWLHTQPAAGNFAVAAKAVDQPPLIVDGRQEFSHFWLYPLLAAPMIALTTTIDLHPGYAFLVINAMLLGLALWMTQRAFSPAISLLLLASPVLWFVNKAQVEVFTFSLLAIAMAHTRRGRFLWAGLTAAIAATQNVPILAAVACFWGAAIVRHIVRRQPLARSWQGSALVVLTLIVGALHPAYYLWRLGVLTPQRLNGGIDLGVPSRETVLAVLVDLNIGLLPWMPLYGLLAAIGLGLLCLPRTAPGAPEFWGGDVQTPVVTGWPFDLRLSAACGLLIGAWFLFVFAQTTNINSGGTVHISRYALWLVPLALPLVATAAGWLQTRAPVLLPVVGLMAVIAYGAYFLPSRAEQYMVPSPQAAFIMSHAPELYRPLPEIFYERHHHTDGGVLGSAAASDCRVILLHAAAPDIPCPLSADETISANRLLAGDWQAIWIIRPGPLGLGPGRVSGALARP